MSQKTVRTKQNNFSNLKFNTPEQIRKRRSKDSIIKILYMMLSTFIYWL